MFTVKLGREIRCNESILKMTTGDHFPRLHTEGHCVAGLWTVKEVLSKELIGI